MTFEEKSAFCAAVGELCSQEGFDDCADLCYQYLDMGQIGENWTTKFAAEYCMQMIEQE